MKLLVTLFSALLLAGCAGSPPKARDVLTPAMIATSPEPLILFELPQLGLSATMIPAGSRDGYRVWRSGGYQSVTFEDGLLVQTRGFGDDLMSADAAGSLAALQGGRQSGYSRHMSYLGRDEQTAFRAMLCRMGPPRPDLVTGFGQSRAAVLQVETCAASGLTVENRYWQDAAGRLLATEQWIGPGLGMARVEWLGAATARDTD